MLKIKHVGFIIFFIFLFDIESDCQVVTRSLQINGFQSARKSVGDKKEGSGDKLQSTTGADTISLPFFDDFSRTDLTWLPGRNYFSKAIYWIGFLGNQHARAFGDEGLSLKTFSGGRRWERVSATNGPIKYVSASFPETGGFGWACGSNGWLATTSDSGQTWTNVANPSTSPLKSLSFQSNTTGLLVDSAGKIFAKGDGTDWSLGNYSNSPSFRANSVAWISTTTAVAVGDFCQIGYTTDGGTNWKIDSLSKSDTLNKSDFAKSFRKVKMIDAAFGLAVGDSGMVYKTVNGCLNWFKCRSLSYGDLLDVDADPENAQHKICWATGSDGTLLFSGDAGNSWVQIRSGIKSDLLCLDLVNGSRGFIGTGDGRILQPEVDPTRPQSRWWEKNSGVFINNTFVEEPISMGVATFDGLNNLGLPYSNVDKKTGICDTLTSVGLDLAQAPKPIHLTFWYQKGGIVDEILPDPEDSLFVQFKSDKNKWVRIWAVGGESVVSSGKFKYAAILLPDSFHYKGFQFRFLNFGIQNGNFDLYHIDYVRLDTDLSLTDSLTADFGISKKPSRLLKSYTALPLEQFKYCVNNNVPIFEDAVTGQAFNLNRGINTPFNGFFYLRSENVDGITNLIPPISGVDGMGSPFLMGYYRRPLSIPSSLFTSSLSSINQYSTILYGFGLNQNNGSNEFTQNDTLLSNLNLSTVMANDDGSAELIRGVSGSFSQGAVKFYLPVTDTITDIALNFPRTQFNFQQTVSFTLILYDSINTQTNYEKPIFRLPVILPAVADSANKLDFFSLRIRPLTQRILQGGKHFYIGWEQGVIDNRNEVLLGCDINSRSDSALHYKEQNVWKKFKFDNYSIIIRPIFGSEVADSLRLRNGRVNTSFFPNPASTSIQNQTAFVNLSIFNQLGQILIQEKFGEPMQDVKIDLKNGLYIVRWQDLEGNWQNQRLIVEKK